MVLFEHIDLLLHCCVKKDGKSMNGYLAEKWKKPYPEICRIRHV